MAALTPMMAQYMEVKNQYKDCILFYRLGDFYEMFFDDALTASKALEITLTEKTADLKTDRQGLWSGGAGTDVWCSVSCL